MWPQFRAHGACPRYSIPGTRPAASITLMTSRLLSGLSWAPNTAWGPRPNDASRSTLLVSGDVQAACPMRIGLSLPPSASGDSDPPVNGDANDTPEVSQRWQTSCSSHHKDTLFRGETCHVRRRLAFFVRLSATACLL